MSEDDNSQIKQEISDNIKNIEEKLINLLNIRELKIEEEINNLNSKINETIEKTNITIENYSSQQLDHKKQEYHLSYLSKYLYPLWQEYH